MKKEKFQEVLDRISKEEFESYYMDHNQRDTKAYFNIGWDHLTHLIKYWGIKKSDSAIRNCSKKVWAKKNTIKMEELAEKIPLDILRQYYDVENHTCKECQNYFNITNNQFFDLLKYYNFHKSVKSHSELAKKTKLERYGDSGYNNREKAKETCLEKYGVENVSQITGVQERNATIKREKYGSLNNWPKGHQTRIEHCGSLEESYRLTAIEVTKTCLEKYGTIRPISVPEIKQKARENFKNTFQEKYGVDNYWEREDAKRSNGSINSSFNIKFKKLLDNLNIENSTEFYLKGRWYDFRVDNSLLEINPTPTHNSTWSPYGEEGISPKYHLEKYKLAIFNNYRCIHIFDWDDQIKIVNSLLPRVNIYARKCEIKEISKKEVDLFLNSYHFQNSCRGQKIKLGLYYNDELIQVMTFGKPRYNSNYEWELLRLCTKVGFRVVGGAEKLFKYFIKNYNPNSIISYCDNSKFKGDVYLRLGMTLKSKGTPTKHWYHMGKKIHISNNLLLRNGFDRLLGDIFGCYGKGTDNESLMIEHGFVEVYDCGQSSYIWKKEET